MEDLRMLKNLREVQSFMNRERLATFATVGPNNEPHIVPVFFTYDDSKVYIQTDRKSVKVRNLVRNDSVAVAVYQGEEAVIIRGKARLIESDEEFVREHRSILINIGLNWTSVAETPSEYLYSMVRFVASSK